VNHSEGWRAFVAGVPRRSNPYPIGSPERRRWRREWECARYRDRMARRLRRRMGDLAAWPPA